MDLILWRHAEAEDIHRGIMDNQRQLTSKGRKQARSMAAWLNARLPADTRIIVSPAARTIQTAEMLQREFEVSNLIFTDASPADLLTAASWPDNNNVLLVGHQPTLGQVAALLVSGRPDAWAIKKGAVWWLRSDNDQQGATLRAAITPEMLDSIAGA